jgi:hypothetical protein
MSEAVRALRRSDGFWNVSVHDQDNQGGPELSGTALLADGMGVGRAHRLARRREVPPRAGQSLMPIRIPIANVGRRARLINIASVLIQ